MRRHHILIPLAALLAISPLILHGCSCGHDFDFHLQSWLDAAHQLRHGTLYPHWAITPAFNAGEPRFLFYPPLSWLLGAVLTLIFPIAATPAVFTFIALTAAGFAMHHLARYFTTPNAALLAAVVYLANPYMLFNAFERTAYAELLAAAWIPLLFLAILRKRPTIHGIAIPLALLWLTNAPAAVMGSYTFAFLAIVRLLSSIKKNARHPERTLSLSKGQSKDPESAPSPQLPNPFLPQSPLRLATTAIAGALLGLALPAFYLIPAAYERRYVQIAMAIIPNMRIQDNFLFGHTADAPHNTVLHTASLLAATLLAITASLLIIAIIKTRNSQLLETTSNIESPHPTNTLENPHPERSEGSPYSASSRTLLPLALLTLLIAFLLTPISLPIWQHLPELSFLQFSWRLLTILSAVFALTVALLLHRTSASPLLLSTLYALLSVFLCLHLYRQPCDFASSPTGVAQAFNTHHGIVPTDEYTPTNADNDVIRPDDPAYWLSTNPNGFAPNTTPNPGNTDITFDDNFPYNQTISTPAPHHFNIDNHLADYLILNLRDYPNWQITATDTRTHKVSHAKFLSRDDGLIAIPLLDDATFHIDITWQITRDQDLGYLISVLALLTLIALNLGAPSSRRLYRR